MKNRFFLGILAFLLIAATQSGCQTMVTEGVAEGVTDGVAEGVTDGVEAGTQRVEERAPVVKEDDTQTIDNGIAQIQQNSGIYGGRWSEILNQVSREIPEKVAGNIREEAQTLAARSLLQPGTQFQCSDDFLAKRAIQGLQRIKNLIAGNPASGPLPPAICLISPADIDLSADPSTWETVTIHGYDLDHMDTGGQPVNFSLVGSNLPQSQPIPEALIQRTSHTEITLNLRELADTLYTKNISKIVPVWEGGLDGPVTGEIVVKAWSPSRDTLTVELGKTTFIPPHVGGDRDFHTGPKDPMYGFVSAKIEVKEHAIKGFIEMNAVQQKGDKTHAKGEKDFLLWDALPANWKIIRVVPDAPSKKPYFISKGGVHTFNQPAGHVVRQFNVYGDHKGNDAGDFTRVEVDWHPITIDIEETQPSWYRP